MMPRMLQVRNVPPEIHAELARRAKLAGTSLSDYVLELLRQETEHMSREEWIAEVHSWEPVKGITPDEIVAAIHEGRDDRFDVDE